MQEGFNPIPFKDAKRMLAQSRRDSSMRNRGFGVRSVRYVVCTKAATNQSPRSAPFGDFSGVSGLLLTLFRISQ